MSRPAQTAERLHELLHYATRRRVGRRARVEELPLRGPPEVTKRRAGRMKSRMISASLRPISSKPGTCSRRNVRIAAMPRTTQRRCCGYSLKPGRSRRRATRRAAARSCSH